MLDMSILSMLCYPRKPPLKFGQSKPGYRGMWRQKLFQLRNMAQQKTGQKRKSKTLYSFTVIGLIQKYERDE